MDTVVARIADYASAMRYEDFSASDIHECKRRVVDTFGCALGAYHAEPSRIARVLALRVNAIPGSHVLGTAHRTLPELAAFAFSSMGRYLDANDTYPGGGGHPSDIMGAVLSVAEATGANGRTVITSIMLAYEIYHALFRAIVMREKGLDHVFYTAVGAAVGAAKVLGLEGTRLTHAISLAVTPNLALEATRRGELSMWKGSAAGNAVRNGVFAALLAAEGMSGPEKPIDGAHGLWELVGKFELAPLGGGGRPYMLNEANIKYFLSEYHSQAPITLALELQPQVALDDIESITIYSYWFTWSEIGSEPEKWRPTTRETADHSLPYMIAAVMIDGRFSDDIFSDERLRDPRIYKIIDKIAVKEDPEYTRQFPETIPCRVEIVTKSGERKVAVGKYPRGHFRNPMTDEEVNAKFRDLAQRVLTQKQVEQSLQMLWKLDQASELGSIFDAMCVDGNRA